MTRTRYTIAAFLQYFGVGRKTKRLADMVFELHLMQDGEEILGAYCWKNTEHIEEISVEYWSLRQLEKKKKAILARIKEAEETLSEAQVERSGFFDRNKDTEQELVKERDSILRQIEEVNGARDAIMATAAQTKRRHSALRLKAKVLQDEGRQDDSAMAECRQDLIRFRDLFTSEKEELIKVNSEIEALKKTLKVYQDRIKNEIRGSKEQVADEFMKISKSNRDITNLKAELSLILDKETELFREVGHFLNTNSNRKDCQDACLEHRGIQEQTRLLNQSVELNQKLIGRMGGK